MAVSEKTCLENGKHFINNKSNLNFLGDDYFFMLHWMVCFPAAVFRDFSSDKWETTGSVQGERLSYSKLTFETGTCGTAWSSDQNGWLAVKP